MKTRFTSIALHVLVGTVLAGAMFGSVLSTGGITTPLVPEVYAQGGGAADPASNCTSGSLCNPLQFGSLREVLLAIVDILLIIAVPIIIFFIVLAGFYYVTAQGNPAKIQEANRALTYALIGGAIILGARVIGAVIKATVDSISV